MRITKEQSYIDKEFNTQDKFYFDKNLSYANALMFYNSKRTLHIKVGRNNYDYTMGIYDFNTNTCLYMSNIVNEIEGKTKELNNIISSNILKRLNVLQVKLG